MSSLNYIVQGLNTVCYIAYGDFVRPLAFAQADRQFTDIDIKKFQGKNIF